MPRRSHVRRVIHRDAVFRSDQRRLREQCRVRTHKSAILSECSDALTQAPRRIWIAPGTYRHIGHLIEREVHRRQRIIAVQKTRSRVMVRVVRVFVYTKEPEGPLLRPIRRDDLSDVTSVPTARTDLRHAFGATTGASCHRILNQLAHQTAARRAAALRLNIEGSENIVGKGHGHLCHGPSMPGAISSTKETAVSTTGSAMTQA